ncbi:MAG: class I SAM-dependent methyltransferase [Candidatus Hodarchaeota archaeon]
MKFVNKLFLKYYIKLHNFSYRKISLYAGKLNKNIHPKHEIMKYYQFFLDNIDEDSKILDIGCGNGYLTKKLAQKARKVIGIDIDKKNIDFAKKYYNNENILYINCEVSKYDFKEKFDYVIMSNVLEHIEDRKKLLERVKNLCEKILIRVPMINRSWLPLYMKKLGLDYRLDDTHYIEYTLDTFTSEIESIGLRIISYEIKFGEIWAKISSS